MPEHRQSSPAIADSADQRFFFTCECGGTHSAPCEPSPAAGLVLVNRLSVWCPIRERASGAGWNITHLVSGLTIPRAFETRDDAGLCAESLGELWDWTLREKPSGDALEAVRDVLSEHGWASVGTAYTDHELPALNDSSSPQGETQ